MKIGHSVDPHLAANPAGTQKAGGNTQGVATASVSPTSGASVTVSSQAKSLGQSGSGGDIDMDRVNAMRTAIAQGKFQVNAEAIADKMLANAQEMLNRTRS